MQKKSNVIIPQGDDALTLSKALFCDLRSFAALESDDRFVE
jgi:hypothetical protein